MKSRNVREETFKIDADETLDRFERACRGPDPKAKLPVKIGCGMVPDASGQPKLFSRAAAERLAKARNPNPNLLSYHVSYFADWWRVQYFYQAASPQGNPASRPRSTASGSTSILERGARGS